MFFEDEYIEPFRQIGAFLECDEDKVYLAYYANPAPLGYLPEIVQERKAAIKEMRRLSARLEKAADIWEPLPHAMKSLVNHSGAITIPQLRNGAKYCREVADHFETFSDTDGRGGKNHAALYVALGTAELFLNLERPITFGHVDGKPTTDFGRTVEFSLNVLDVNVDWRAVAKQAYDVIQKE